MTAKLVVLSSDNGSTLQAILDACTTRMLNARVVFVVVSDDQARALDRAERAGVPTLYHPLQWYLDTARTHEDYDAELAEQLAHYQPDLIVLAGWAHVISTTFLDRFAGKLVSLPTDTTDVIDTIKRVLSSARSPTP